MKLYPIQHVVNRKLEWFKCSCGNTQFHITQEFLEGDEPQLGVVEKHFNCKCGRSYIWEYGDIRIAQFDSIVSGVIEVGKKERPQTRI